MAKSMHMLCTSCFKEFEGIPKFTLWGLKKCMCPHCNRIVLYPMGLGQLILNWGILFIFLLLAIVSFGNGGFVLPGIFVILAGIAVSKDIIVRSDIRKLVAAQVSPVVDDNQSDEEISRSECRITPYANSRNYGSKPNNLHWKPYILIFSLVIVASLLTIIRYHYSNTIPQRTHADQKREINTALNEVQKTFSDIVEKPNDPKGLLLPIAKRTKGTDTRQKDKEEAAKVKHFLQESMAEVDIFDSNCASDLDNVGLYNLLDAKRIENDKNFSESRVILSGANSVLLRFESGHKQLMRNCRGKIKTLDISSPMKEAMLKGYDDSAAKSMKTFNDNIELQRKVLREFEEIIDLLESRKGYWVVENNRILFFTENDAACYNAHVASILRILKSLSEIEHRTEKKTNAEIDSLMKELCK